MKKYKLEIKITDIELNKGPVISLPFDMVQEAKTDILKEIIEAAIVEMEKSSNAQYTLAGFVNELKSEDKT